MTDKQLVDEICETIAKHTPYSVQEISNAYDYLKSFDKVIAACRFASAFAIAPLVHIVKSIPLPEPPEESKQ